MSYTNEEPTSKLPSIEPTQRASYPYEYTFPYYGLPEIPPPPPSPKKNSHSILWSIIVTLLITSIVSLSFLVEQWYGHSNSSVNATTPTILPTPKVTVIIETPTPQPPTPTTVVIPTPTPVRTVAYYANDIYNDFYANGLGGPNPQNDTKWSCCTYVPAGGAIYWTDRGYAFDIATFYNISDAETDARDLYRIGWYTNVVHNCLLSYEKSVPTSILSEYVQLMQIYCN